MTKEQMDKLTEEQRNEFTDVTCHEFDKNQSLEEYTEAIRDYIYIWRRLDEGRKAYTFESITKSVRRKMAQIKAFFDEQAAVDEAAFDVDFVGL